MKSLLKKNFAFAMLASSVALTVGGITLTVLAGQKKSQVIDDFSQTEEFKNEYKKELEKTETQYSLNQIDEKEYKEKMQYLNGDIFIENKLNDSKSNYNSELKNANFSLSLGSGLSLVGMSSSVITGTFASVIQKQVKRENKLKKISTIIEELNNNDKIEEIS